MKDPKQERSTGIQSLDSFFGLFFFQANLPGTVRKRGTLTMSTEWAVDSFSSDPSTLPASVQTFCRNFPVYFLKKLGEDGVELVTKGR